jgi:hypothetical protein
MKAGIPFVEMGRLCRDTVSWEAPPKMAATQFPEMRA